MEFTKKTGYIFIKTATSTTKHIFDTLKTNDWVIGAWVVTGDYDIIAWVNAKNEDDLFTYAQTVRHYAGVEYTNSHYVYNGYVQNFETFTNPNGAWVRVRGLDHLDGTVQKNLKDYAFVGGWVTIPGDYDYLVWTHGKTTHEAMENVLRMTETQNWKTYTHVPVYTYLNPTFRTI
jgi:hypothetical protein